MKFFLIFGATGKYKSRASSAFVGSMGSDYFVSAAAALLAQHFFSAPWQLLPVALLPAFVLVLVAAPEDAAVLEAQQPVVVVVHSFFFFLPPPSFIAEAVNALPAKRATASVSVNAIFLYIS
ncbi:MAG: hypothetical protein IPN95_27325 [Bacteroidetes bacterium]|nr:hypothetical protein [Bacteroidota bacterium]MBP6640418.1 hypothetical protein [Bacteroidia bacterium]